MNLIPFPEKRIATLRKHALEKRQIQKEHRQEYDSLLTELEGKGINNSKINKIMNAPGLYCLEQKRNFNAGISRHDADSKFPELSKRYDEFIREQRRVRTIVNSLSSSMNDALNELS